MKDHRGFVILRSVTPSLMYPNVRHCRVYLLFNKQKSPTPSQSQEPRKENNYHRTRSMSLHDPLGVRSETWLWEIAKREKCSQRWSWKAYKASIWFTLEGNEDACKLPANTKSTPDWFTWRSQWTFLKFSFWIQLWKLFLIYFLIISCLVTLFVVYLSCMFRVIIMPYHRHSCFTGIYTTVSFTWLLVKPQGHRLCPSPFM